jgi:hypothetical protein
VRLRGIKVRRRLGPDLSSDDNPVLDGDDGVCAGAPEMGADGVPRSSVAIAIFTLVLSSAGLPTCLTSGVGRGLREDEAAE